MLYDNVPDPDDFYRWYESRKSIEEIEREKDEEMNYWEEHRCEWDEYLPNWKT